MDSGYDTRCADSGIDLQDQDSQITPNISEEFTNPTRVEKSERDAIYARSQQIVEELNNKRKQDTQLLENFKKSLQQQVVEVSGRLEKHLFSGYDSHGSLIQQRAQELCEVLGRIEKIETELTQFREALQILFQEMSR